MFCKGKQPTKDTRLVNLASIESLIMVLAELKKHHVSRDDIQKTFENATFSYMIEERCPYHFHLGINHCSVARCHAGAKLISAYLNQLYVPEPAAAVASVQYDKPTETNRQIDFIDQSDKPSKTDSVASSYLQNDQKNQNQINESNMQRAILNQRKQVLLKALQSIDKQIEELDLNCDT